MYCSVQISQTVYEVYERGIQRFMCLLPSESKKIAGTVQAQPFCLKGGIHQGPGVELLARFTR